MNEGNIESSFDYSNMDINSQNTTIYNILEEKEENFSHERYNSTEKSIIDNQNSQLKNLVKDNFYNNSPTDKIKSEKNKNLIDSNSKIIAIKTPEKNNKYDDNEKLMGKCKKNLYAYFSQKQID